MGQGCLNRNMEINKRIINMDFLRVTAAFMVVFLHVSAEQWYSLSPTSSSWQILNFYDTLVRSCVPIFFMISGRFLLSKELDIKRFFKKNVFKIIVVYVVWTFLYAVNHAGVNSLSSFAGVRTIISFMIRNQAGHLWFLQAMIAVYLLLPLLYSIVKYESGKYLKYAVYVFFIFAVLKYTATLFLQDVGALELLVNKISYPLVEYSGYFMLGYYISIQDTKKIKNCYLIISFVLVVGISMLIGQWDAIALGKPNGILYDNFCLPVFIEAVLIYIFFQNNSFQNTSLKFKKCILFLSKCSFGIYLLHPFIIEKLTTFFNITSTPPMLLSVPLKTILVIVLSVCITVIISRIPFLNKWLV